MPKKKTRINHLQIIGMKYLQRAAVSNADLAKRNKVNFVSRNKAIGKYPLLKRM